MFVLKRVMILTSFCFRWEKVSSWGFWSTGRRWVNVDNQKSYKLSWKSDLLPNFTLDPFCRGRVSELLQRRHRARLGLTRGALHAVRPGPRPVLRPSGQGDSILDQSVVTYNCCVVVAAAQVTHSSFMPISASLPPSAALFAGLLSGLPLSRIGRRPTLLLTAVLYVLSFVVLGSSSEHESLTVILGARLCNGMALGLSVPSAQIYVSPGLQSLALFVQ